jgi:thiamine-phosphate pyrophosphorylase
MKMSTLPAIYAVTSRELTGLSHLEQCERLIDGGAKLIQIRDKSLSSESLFAEVTSCVQLARRHDVSVLINDRVDIALACDTDGVHLGQTDMNAEAARMLLGDEKIIGVSTHNEDEVRRALSTDADYIAIGPVFGTTTKENPDPPLAVEGFRHLRKMISDRPVVAIGGITAENHREVLSAGADSVAVISALYSPTGEIESNFRRLAL